MPLQRGSVIWATVPDSQGRNPKDRPLVVITATADIQAGTTIAAVAVSTSVTNPPVAYEVPLPWAQERHPVTGLYSACVAVCNWIRPVNQSDIRVIRGPLDQALTDKIVELADEAVKQRQKQRTK